MGRKLILLDIDGNLTPQQGYKTQTLMTLIMGLAAMVDIFVLNLIF